MVWIIVQHILSNAMNDAKNNNTLFFLEINTVSIKDTIKNRVPKAIFLNNPRPIPFI